MASSNAQKQAPIPANTSQVALPPVSRLASAKRGRLLAPTRILIYGNEGVGKSTLFEHSPNPVWLDIEDGTAKLEVTRYPFRVGPDGQVLPDGHVPHTYEEVLAAIDDLTRSPHDYKTLVVDTAGRLESLLWQFILDRDEPEAENLTGLDRYGYGKGPNVAVDEWRSLCSKLDRLRVARGMTIAMVAHSVVRNFKNPEAADFDRYQVSLQDKAAGFLRGWADIVGFLRFEEGVGKEKKHSRPKGWSTDQRVLCLSRSAAYDAKGRGMPPELMIPAVEPWSAMAEALVAADNTDPKQLVAAIDAEIERIGDPDLKPKVSKAVAEAVAKRDIDALHRYVNDLKRRPQAGAKETDPCPT